jgi:hypothetical protein
VATQAWYADDSQAAGKLISVFIFWKTLVMFGPKYGYFPKPSKTCLVVKPHLLTAARLLFADTGIRIADGGAKDFGARDLGAAIGSDDFAATFLQEKVAKWSRMVEDLAIIAETQPHAAYAGFTHGLRHKWTYTERTMPNLKKFLDPLEKAIRQKFLPALFGSSPLSDPERRLFALPVKYGGLAIDNPTTTADAAYSDSLIFSESLKNQLLAKDEKLNVDHTAQQKIKSLLKSQRKNRLEKEFETLLTELPDDLRRAAIWARLPGSSTLFTTLPYEKYDFCFKSKRDFKDLICMRYRKHIEGLPGLCVCGEPFTVDHSQICPVGGFINMRHNDARDWFAGTAKKVFRDVGGEPELQPLSGERMKYKSANIADDARSDVRIRGFWSRLRNAFFEFRVFYPHASSYSDKQPSSLFQSITKDRRREYGQRIAEVEDGDFTPMVMSSTGALNDEMSMAIKHLAKLSSRKMKIDYSKVIGILRCQLAFALARSALVCLRGSRSIRSFVQPCEDPLSAPDLAAAELL